MAAPNCFESPATIRQSPALAEGKAGKLGGAHHTDDAKHSGILREIKAKMLVQWFFIGLEEAFYKCFIYHRNQLGGFIIGGGKAAPAQNGDAKVFEIIRTHAVP